MEFILTLLDPVLVLSQLRSFLEQGGSILMVIMIATFLLWALIIDRYYYFWRSHPRVFKSALSSWNIRNDKNSWHAHQIRTRLISTVQIQTEKNIHLIKAVVSIAPLLGLLGTVVGMVEVFDVMAFTGSSNARSMAAGVSKATIPTMAGMVASISGLYFSSALDRRGKREVQRLANRLIIE